MLVIGALGMQDKLSDLLKSELGNMNQSQKRKFTKILQNTLPNYIKGAADMARKESSVVKKNVEKENANE